jgi:uncharacterized membrane protein YedE/YeeE
MEAIDGGVLIGVAATMMLLFNGRVTGISGILGGLLNPVSKDKSWRILFLLGLLVGGFFLRFFHPVSFVTVSNAWRIDYMIAGFFVGFGTLLGNGCTSGHGVCGISRFSFRSIISTIIFMLSGILSVVFFKLIRGSL